MKTVEEGNFQQNSPAKEGQSLPLPVAERDAKVGLVPRYVRESPGSTMAACIMSSDLDNIADPLHSASGVFSNSTSDLRSGKLRDETLKMLAYFIYS
jgi:hypothetical protein